MAGFDNDVMYAKNADFTQSDNQAPSESNGLSTNGQMWIGTTAVNAGGTHINVGSLTSPNNSITFGYSSPNITAVVNSAVVPDLHVAKWIVNAIPNSGGNATTIASALASAVSGETIFVMPGTYTENLTLKAGVNIVAFDADAETPNVTIIGKMTATFSGTCSLSGIRLQTNGDYFLQITGANPTTVKLINCFLNATNANGINCTAASGLVEVRKCDGNCATNTYFIYTAGALKCYHSYLASSPTTTPSTFASADCEFYWTFLACPVSASGTGTIGGEWTYFALTNTTAITSAGTVGGNLFNFCRIETGTASAISVSVGSTLQITNSSIFSTNANTITGAGTINYGHIDFYGASHTQVINTTTQVPLNFIVSAVPVALPAGDYTLVNSDYFVGATTGAARAITLPASPVSGETHIIKDITGTGGTNNITIGGNGHTIDGGASYVINTNYGSATVIYNGTNWFVI